MSLEGTRLGYYQLLHQIGSGGMGTIYLAQDTHLPRQVAIKVVRTDAELYKSITAAEKVARLFQHEIQAIAQLDHPHILPVIDTGQAQVNNASYIYLVMPYCPAGSLMDWLRKRQQSQPLDLQDISTLLSQAAEALHYAHEHHIIHQDVKPSNFLLRARTIAGQVDPLPDLLLADFGLARLLSASASTTTQGIRGTPFYMAPEQWDGEPVPASDQYALAIMAFQLITGQFPFQGGPGQVMRKHYMEQPPTPSSMNPQLTPTMDTVILRALSKDATERFPSIKAFAHAFLQAISSSDGLLSIALAKIEETTSSEPVSSLPTKALPILADATTALIHDQALPTPEHGASSPALPLVAHVADNDTLLLKPAPANIVHEIIPTIPNVPSPALPAPLLRAHAVAWLTPTDPDNLDQLLDRPPARKKPSHLYRGLLIGMLALILLAASSTLLYKNSVDASSSHITALVNRSLPSQTPSITAGSTSGTTATTDTNTSIDANGPGTTPFPSPTAAGTMPAPSSTVTPGFTPTAGATPIPSPPVVTPQPTPTPIPPIPGPHSNLLVNPGFEGPSGWCAWDNNTNNHSCNGDFEDSKQESGNSHSGGWHRVNGYAAADITTFQVVRAPVNGNYYASVWVETGCNTTGTYFFIKDTSTGRASGVVNISECIQGWSLVQTGPFAATQGESLAIELRSINNTNQWARFDDASMWYQ